MIKKILLCSFMIAASCSGQSNKVEQIANSDKVNLREFTKVSNKDEHHIDFYRYNDDTGFIYKEHFYPGREKRKGYSFYYQGKKIGKWRMFTEDGNLLGIINYKDDKKNGFDLGYYNGILKYKEFYQAGKLVYLINYDDDGNFMDSISNR